MGLVLEHGDRSRGDDGRESCLGDLDPRTVQILLQACIELSQPTVFQVGDTLLLVLDITAGSEFVGWHRGWVEVKSREREKGGRGGFWIGSRVQELG